MTTTPRSPSDPGEPYRSPIVGPPPSPPGGESGVGAQEERDPWLVELNVVFPGGLLAARRAFHAVWRDLRGLPAPTTDDTPDGLETISPHLYQAVLARAELDRLVDLDRSAAGRAGFPPAVFRVWPDYTLAEQIDRSAPTVKADAAWRSYAARGQGIVWAVVDSGIDATHPHFAGLELAGGTASGRTTGVHRDFSHLVKDRSVVPPEAPSESSGDPAPDPTAGALEDESGHGTHVAGIIAGRSPEGAVPVVASSEDPGSAGGYTRRERVGELSGMAPDCQLVSLKVMRRTTFGSWVTSSAAVIRALTYLRAEVNVDATVLRVHGVNMSLGCDWDPAHYAAGQSPLCQALNQLSAAGVVVVVSAGNSGAGTATANAAVPSALLGSITEPAHAQNCIAVGSTHRDAPHAFGVTWTSSKGPTLDGRSKPDVVAPGEWITSAATGRVLTSVAGDATPAPAYVEQSGTSMAAPHVSGVLAAFLSARPEFIGRPEQVKALLIANATDLGRERYAQGAGLVDLMRMLANI